MLWLVNAFCKLLDLCTWLNHTCASGCCESPAACSQCGTSQLLLRHRATGHQSVSRSGSSFSHLPLMRAALPLCWPLRCLKAQGDPLVNATVCVCTLCACLHFTLACRLKAPQLCFAGGSTSRYRRVSLEHCHSCAGPLHAAYNQVLQPNLIPGVVVTVQACQMSSCRGCCISHQPDAMQPHEHPRTLPTCHSLQMTCKMLASFHHHMLVCLPDCTMCEAAA